MSFLQLLRSRHGLVFTGLQEPSRFLRHEKVTGHGLLADTFSSHVKHVKNISVFFSGSMRSSQLWLVIYPDFNRIIHAKKYYFLLRETAS